MPFVRRQPPGIQKALQCHAMESREPVTGRPARQGDLASRLEMLNGLLGTLTDVLEIREVFDQVSQLVQQVLPHDLMGVLEVSEGGARIRLRAGAGPGEDTPTFEAAVPEPLWMRMQSWGAMIIEDYQSHPLAKDSPPLKLGMKTVLSAPIRFGGRLQAALTFFSRQPGWFSREDLPVAEWVAGHIALLMSHHQLAEKARLAAEANARAERLESRVRQLTEAVDALGGYRRVIGKSRKWSEALKARPRSPAPKRRCSCWGSQEPEKKSSRVSSIARPRVVSVLLWP